MEGVELPPVQTPVLSSEAGIFDLTAADLKDVRVWREAPIIEVREVMGNNGRKRKVRKRIGGSGLWHQVPAFWTTAAPAPKMRKKAGAENTDGVESAESPLVARYPGFNVPDDAVVVREETKTSRSGETTITPIIVKPAENTRKMLEEIDKAKQADLWRVLVALSNPPPGAAHRATRSPPPWDRSTRSARRV